MNVTADGSTRSRTDWAEARSMHELEGWSFTAIAELMDVSTQAVSQRAKRESWINKGHVVAAAREAALRKFIERDSDTVLRHMAERHALSNRLGALLGRHTARLERNDLRVAENPLHTLVDLIRSLKLLDELDQSLLGAADWVDAVPDALEDGGELTPEKIRARINAIRAVQKAERAEGLQ